MSPAPSPQKNKPKFGQPEPKNVKELVIKISIILVALGAIGWLVATASPEKTLVCRNSGPSSLIGFGSCTAE